MEAILKSISAISSREVIDDEKMLTLANDFLWLSEQDVIILNTMEKELEYYEENVLKTTVALSFTTYPAYMEYVEAHLLVLDTEEQKIFLLNLDGTLIQAFQLPDEKDDRYVYLARCGNGSVYVESAFGKVKRLLLREEQLCFDDFPDWKDYIMVPLGERELSGCTVNMVGDLLYADEDGKVYLAMDSLSVNGQEYHELSIKRYCHNVLEEQYILDDGVMGMSPKGIRFCEDLKIRLLFFRGAEIVWATEELKPISACASNLEHRISAALHTESKSDESKSTKTVSPASRSQALNTAYRYTNYTWKITKANQKTLSNTRLPGYIAAMDLSSGAKTLQGLPYCWGGWDSFDGFTAGIADGGQAGNIIRDYGDTQRPGTNGIDCSGLVSRAYNLSTKYGTSMLGGAFKSTNYAAACCSDFFLKSGHVVLFHRKISTTNYMIIESTTDGIDKVTSRVFSQTLLDSKNYVPYAGWSTGHKESAAWSSDSSYHYHVCANGCGKKYASYAHNWVQYSGYRKCSVCGYQKSI